MLFVGWAIDVPKLWTSLGGRILLLAEDLVSSCCHSTTIPKHSGNAFQKKKKHSDNDGLVWFGATILALEENISRMKD